MGLGNPIKSGLPEADKCGRAWKVVSGEISPNAFHCATLPDGPNCQWKGGEFERVEAKNRAALKAAVEATIEANGYFTDPDWREVVSPDGVKGFITSFGAPARRARALPHPLTADLSIPPGGVERDSSLATAGGRLFGSRNSSKEIERVLSSIPKQALEAGRRQLGVTNTPHLLPDHDTRSSR